MLPNSLPYPAVQEYVPKLEEWLIDTFTHTTFNVTDPLPKMSGTPMKIHISSDAVPHNVSTPILIPHHWKEQVKEQVWMLKWVYYEKYQLEKQVSGALEWSLSRRKMECHGGL